MIPTFDVEIELDYEIAELRDDLTAEDVASGFTEHHGYECVGLPSWEDVVACLKDEAEILAQAAKSGAQDGITEILDAIQEADDVHYADRMSVFQFNDVGVGGLSLALSAARAATFYSCSGSHDTSHHADHPLVGVVPDAERAQLLAELTERAGCGIGQEWGRWYVYAASVTEMHALAQLILAQRDVLDALPEPQWAHGLVEQLELMQD
ncbi:hypothetical protein N7925_15760 [Streptomyces sp. CA-278952]|uniref:hypothetical protein n=1 Tax=Streptomyces sp. CA-278952 TaxID=2980556 RepID=UPI002367943B|nr:hypothetical protein [Streptomyces sp. CA-278952]WDG29697.1 hypothetical protein N7925_15760 [Streptomyces sp. CA-278952]